MGNYKKSAEEISTIMKYAYEQTIPITPRGSGRKICNDRWKYQHKCRWYVCREIWCDDILNPHKVAQI